MTWDDLFLTCFLVGFVLILVSSLGGGLHLHFGHLHIGHAGTLRLHARSGGGHGRGSELAPVNFGTVAAFLAWFGGAGYLLTHYYGVWLLLALGVATVAGLAAASIVFWFLAKVLISSEENLDPADYALLGVLGQISSAIHAGGTGELVFSQQGMRKSTAARSDEGMEIPRDTEVVVTRYENGIAYVRRWEEFADQAEGKG